MRTLVTTYLFPTPKWPAGIQAQDLLNTNRMFLPLSCWGNGRRIAHKLHIAALCESLSQIPTDSLLIVYKFSISLLTVNTVSGQHCIESFTDTLLSLSYPVWGLSKSNGASPSAVWPSWHQTVISRAQQWWLWVTKRPPESVQPQKEVNNHLLRAHLYTPW